MENTDISHGVKNLIQDLSQYIEFQKSLGLTHMELNEDTQKIVSSWGTREWKQHRFQEQGSLESNVFLVDSQGNFFQGKSGRLLVKILAAMHLSPDQVYICNAADGSQIKARVSASHVKIIIALGQKACDLLLENSSLLKDIQGEFQSCQGTMVMPTLHPEQLIKDPGLKRGVWEDMQKVMKFTGSGSW